MTDKQQPTVLLVEDNAHVLALNQSVLERRGYSVLTARSLAAVRQLLARKPRVDVAVLDIRLPDGNGLDFVPELRQTAPVPVLMLTSCRDYDDMVRGLTGGADDYMTKPYRIDELLARIAALLLKRESVHPPSEVVRGAAGAGYRGPAGLSLWGGHAAPAPGVRHAAVSDPQRGPERSSRRAV